MGVVLFLLANAAMAADATTEGPPASGSAVVVDRVIAVVNEELVLLSEVYAFGGPYIEEVAAADPSARVRAEGEVLERLLERKLVEQEMRELKIDLSDQDLDRSISDIAQRNGYDVDGLRREVERSGMSWDQYRSELRENLRDMKFAQMVLRPRITVTEDELRDAWKRTGATAAPVSFRVQAIVLALPPGIADSERDQILGRARQLKSELAAGADFAATAQANDQAGFGEKGGEMGTFKAGELVETLDRAIQALPVGEVSDPVIMGNAVFLLRVAERIAGADDFESRRDELAEAVFQSRLEDEKGRWYQEARRRATIRLMLAQG